MRFGELCAAYDALPAGRILLVRPSVLGGWEAVYASQALALACGRDAPARLVPKRNERRSADLAVPPESLHPQGISAAAWGRVSCWGAVSVDDHPAPLWAGLATKSRAKRFPGIDLDSVLAALEVLPFGVLMRSRTGGVCYSNPAAASFLAVARDTLIAQPELRSHRRLLREDGTALANEELPSVQALRQGIGLDNVLMGVEDRGQLINWIRVGARQVEAQKIGSVATFLDVTAQQLAFMDLREREELVALSLRLAHCATWQYDIASRKLRFVDGLRDFLGWEPEEANFSFLDFVHPDDIEPVQAAMRDHLAGGPPVEINHRAPPQAGEDRWFRSVAEMRRGPDGKPQYWFGFLAEITARVRQEARLEGLAGAAEAANRAKSEFIANMSHEIRTPLNGVIGLTGALAATSLNEAQSEMVRLIQCSGAALERLLNDVLDLSKIEAGQLSLEDSAFDLRLEIENTANLVRARCDQKGLALNIAFGENARGLVQGDPLRLRQVVNNLVSNAAKFTESGHIDVRVSLDESQTEQFWLGIEVEDTGIGFDSATAESLFDRFSQADNSITRRFGGTGLGLAICRAITQAMGGQISARSSPGKGSCFSVKVPTRRTLSLSDYDRFNAGAAEPALPVEEEASTQFQRLRVLLAEDHPVNRRVVELVLGPMGIILTMAENGAEAVEAFRCGQFDLILMDMQMPVLDGLSAAMQIREMERAQKRRRTPMAMLTANAMPSHREHAARAEVDHFIPKPVTPQGLIAGVEHTLLVANEGEALDMDHIAAQAG